MPSTGVDRRTGRLLTDWDHVLQSLEVIFSTRFGSRVMRRWFGSNIPVLLGRNMVPETFLRFYAALGVALTQEPRVELIRVSPLSVTRTGRAGFLVELHYRPRGHLGDFTVEGTKRITVSPGSGDRLEVSTA
ncbi:GPW/gp25 family protein [Kaistia sp. MMO-174]|uniref:GPW/gp25 family protein n=1 Tax=Kaistia sp. MMO-174 TaxID=3081256 RepID=UPI00301B1AE1